MKGQGALEYLKELYAKGEPTERGRSLKRALLCVALPAAAGLATACYGVPYDDAYYDWSGSDTEVCSNNIDDDYDGRIDCDDPDCERLEACLGCDDGFDNDGNGRSDCADPSCSELEICAVPDACGDAQDNDADGLTDCDDPDCAGTGECS